MISRLFGGLIFIFAFGSTLVGQTGGPYDLSHNVIASGGGKSTGSSYSVDGTVGQGIAGTQSSFDSYSLRGGFWAFQSLTPTAGRTSIGGRIRTADGNGIKNVAITLTNAASGAIVTALSTSFGYYRFDDILVGQTYVLSVGSKRFTFDPPARVITLHDELTDEDFIALPW